MRFIAARLSPRTLEARIHMWFDVSVEWTCGLMCDVSLCLTATGLTGTPLVGRHGPASSMMSWAAPTCEAVKAFFPRRRTQSIALLANNPVTRTMQSVMYQIISHSNSHKSKNMATLRWLSNFMILQLFKRISCLTIETIPKTALESSMYENVSDLRVSKLTVIGRPTSSFFKFWKSLAFKKKIKNVAVSWRCFQEAGESSQWFTPPLLQWSDSSCCL